MYSILLAQGWLEQIPGGALGILIIAIAIAIVLNAVLKSPPFKALAAILQALAARIGGRAYVEQQQLEIDRKLKTMGAELAAAKLKEALSKLATESEIVNIKRRLPSGTVTILFSDIDDWTPIAAQGDEQAFEILQEHNQIVRQLLRAYEGLEVKNYGDGFMIAFPSAKKAILYALELQRTLDEFNRSRERPLRVAIGINSGEPIQHAEDYIGHAVNLAARIQSEAHGGQILISEVVKNLAGPIQGVQYLDRGLSQLQGIAEPQRLYEVLAIAALMPGSTPQRLDSGNLNPSTQQKP
ncbi:MAG: adenylate/guanylate cyclase domain-containing protein [Candidatus Bipolaricaulota bacterium]|nr:adenylate/guanylate cyclase domain-containing protein [Candidatus Bipolaricaulota bacterium]